MSEDQRQNYRAIIPGAAVFYRVENVPVAEVTYRLGMAENVSLGGVFIGSRHPLRPGTAVRLQLFSPADPDHAPAVHARGVVRWRQLWREPRGMGIQFLEFEGLGARALESWLATIMQQVPGAQPGQPELIAGSTQASAAG
jgi:PilZ domain